MMIVMKAAATEDEIQSVIERIEAAGARAHPSRGEEVTVIGAIGDIEHIARLDLEGAPGVDHAVPILKPYKLASNQLRGGERSVVEVDGRLIGGDHFSMIAGPCTVESRDQLLTTARIVRDAGGSLLRGGAYKPRTSPYAFQGLGQEGLRLLAEAKAETGLPIVTELMDARDLEPILEVADVIQVGARNMQNYPLLAEIGRSGRTALLKRGLSATLEELLMAAEYILKEGNPNVLLCERGIRTFETAYRYTLDLTAVPVLKELSHLPVIVDPSHAAGRRDIVTPLSLAAAAVGADGIIVEIHPDPEQAICDGPQALYADGFAAYVEQVERAAAVAGKALSAVGGCAPRPLERRGPRRRPRGRARRARRAGGARRGGAWLRPGARGARRRARPRRRDGRVRDARGGARGRLGGVRRGARAGAAGDGARRAGGGGPRLRGHGRGLDQARAGGHGRGPPLHRRAPPRGRGDGRGRARPRGALRRRDVVPDAHGADGGGSLRPPLPPARRPRGAPRRDRRRDPRPPDGVGLAPAARARQRPRRPGRGRARGRAPAAHGSELPRRDPRGGRLDGDLARHLPLQRRRARRRHRRHDVAARRGPRCARRPRRRGGGSGERGGARGPPAVARSRPRRWRGARAARRGAQPAGRRGRGRARARARLGQHRRYGALPRGRQHLGLDRAVDRRRRRRAPGGGAHRRARLHGGAAVTFFAPAPGGLRGTLTAPSDKSISHRAALMAAMTSEPVHVINYLDAGDTRSTLRAVESLGALVEERADGMVIRGTGLRAAAQPTGAIDVGNAGTLLRLLPGWLAGQADSVWILDGDESIRRRPVDRIAEALRRVGARRGARRRGGGGGGGAPGWGPAGPPPPPSPCAAPASPAWSTTCPSPRARS